MNGKPGLGDERGLGFECQMFSFAADSGSVVVPADWQHQPGQGDPGPGVLRRPLVLLAVARCDLLVAHEPFQLGRRVGARGDALQLQVLAGSGRDLGGAGVVSNALDDNFARRLYREETGTRRNINRCEKEERLEQNVFDVFIYGSQF